MNIWEYIILQTKLVLLALVFLLFCPSGFTPVRVSSIAMWPYRPLTQWTDGLQQGTQTKLT